MSDRPSTKIPFDDMRLSELLWRSSSYHLLAILFRHPKAKAGDGHHLLQTCLEAWEEMFVSVSRYRSGSLNKFSGKLQSLPGAARGDDCAREYEACFGHTAHSQAPPYELEYGEAHSHRQPQELADIAAFYGAFGLRISRRSGERADHVSVECEFMHFILFKEFFALANEEEEHAQVCNDAAKRFLSDHLAKWVPAFAARLEKRAASDWLKTLAEFAFRFILGDCEVQAVKAGVLDLPIRAVDEKTETGCISCSLGKRVQSYEF